VDHDVDGARDLLAHGRMRQSHPGHQRKRLDPAQRVLRRVRMHRAERSLVPRVERLQHVERLRPAHLADHDPVRPHPKGVAHQLADGDLATPLQVRRP
jgi:hypothetical protein